MIDSISSYLYAQAIDSTKSSQQVTTGKTDASSEGFAKTLTEAISSYSAMSELSETLSGSVLGTIAESTTDLAALSKDLLSTGSGRKVIQELSQGHLDSIVLSGNKDESEAVNLNSTLDSYSKSVEETTSLENIVGQLASLIEKKENDR